MILDTSAVVAIAFEEEGCEALLSKIGRARTIGIGAPTVTETAIVLSARLKRDARGLLSRFLTEAGAVVVPFGEEHFGAAVDAWLRFGRGRHPAALNLGDCFSYSTARLAGDTLLCVGDDFPKTDLDIA